MRVPVSWLRECVDLPADLSARALGDRLLAHFELEIAFGLCNVA